MEAVVDLGAIAPIVGPKIAKRMGVWRHVKKICVKQGNSPNMKEGKFVVNSCFSFLNKPDSEYPLDAEVFDIGYQDIIIGLSWL